MNRSEQTIYELLSPYSKEQIDEMIPRLSRRYQEIILLKYGNDFENPQTDESWNRSLNNSFYQNVVPKMIHLLENPNEVMKNREQTIYELLTPYTEDEIDFVLKMLPKKDKELILLKYGEDLRNPVKSSDWNKELAKKFSYLVFKIRKMLENPTKEPSKRNKTIVEMLKIYTLDQIKNAILQLSEEEVEILKLKYGENFDRCNESSCLTERQYYVLYRMLIPKMKTILKHMTDPSSFVKPLEKSLEEYTFEEIEEEIKRLSKEEQEIIRIVRNNEFVDKKTYVLNYKKDYNKILTKLRQRLKRTRKKKIQDEQKRIDFYYLFNCSKEQLEENIKKLSKQEQFVINLRYGLTCDRCYTLEEIGKILSCSREWVRLIEKKALKNLRALITSDNLICKDQELEEQDFITLNDYEQILMVLNSEQFINMPDILTYEQKIILILKLGYVNEKSFTTEVVADLLNLTERETLELEKEALLLYDGIVNMISNEESNNKRVVRMLTN